MSIDTECDHDPNWIRSNPLTFNSIVDGLPNRLQPAFDSVGAVPTYLLTVEVLEDDACVESLKNMPGNYEYGTHLHAAFIEPQKKFHKYDGVDSPDFQCSYEPDVEYQKLSNLTNLFEEKLGYRPTSFRAGRYGASINSINSLEKLGYKVDTSVTPYIKWKEPNATVDFRKAPEQPYFPSRNKLIEPASESGGRILEVPVTVKPRLLKRTPIWFRPWFASVPQMQDIFRYQMRKHADKIKVNINMMFHSMEVIEKASPYPQSRADVDRYIDDMHRTLEWCAGEGVKFCGLSDVRDMYSTSKRSN